MHTKALIIGCGPSVDTNPPLGEYGCIIGVNYVYLKAYYPLDYLVITDPKPWERDDIPIDITVSTNPRARYHLPDYKRHRRLEYSPWYMRGTSVSTAIWWAFVHGWEVMDLIGCDGYPGKHFEGYPIDPYINGHSPEYEAKVFKLAYREILKDCMKAGIKLNNLNKENLYGWY